VITLRKMYLDQEVDLHIAEVTWAKETLDSPCLAYLALVTLPYTSTKPQIYDKLTVELRLLELATQVSKVAPPLNSHPRP